MGRVAGVGEDDGGGERCDDGDEIRRSRDKNREVGGELRPYVASMGGSVDISGGESVEEIDGFREGGV